MTGTQQPLASSDVDGGRQERIDYIKLKLAVAGAELGDNRAALRLNVPDEVVSHLKERIRLSFGLHSPIDKRVQAFLDRFLKAAGVEDVPRLPGLGEAFILDRKGMATELSLPEQGDRFESEIVSSYRLLNGQGVLHNPRSDRRTTQGVFHISEGGWPIPYDKVAVPARTFARILDAALHPPDDLLQLPFTIAYDPPVGAFVSLLMRPLVVPEVAGVTPSKTMELRFLAPGNLVSNLDFVERIFDNAGDPFLPQNDAGLDVGNWTGHTGYVILAPHLVRLTKKSLGLPQFDAATDRQKRDRMCWKQDDELYNGGDAFKLTARDEAGVIVTIIADNYYGYCKKEVKTQHSYAANLLGGVEEEHSGGAIVFPQFDLGKTFTVHTHLPGFEHTFAQSMALYGDKLNLQPEGYAVDPVYPEICYVPENVEIDVNQQTVAWQNETGSHSLPLDPARTYVVPSGFKIRLEKEADSGQWRLIGTAAEGTFCHKPGTVSGGGKSEISKSISDSVMHSPVFITDFDRDMDAVGELLRHDYSARFRKHARTNSRPILSPERSLGSVIKLLTPSDTLYIDSYNEWLDSVPHHVRKLLFIVKRFYRPEMADDWRAHFSVDVVNGRPGNELRYHGEKLVTHYMRVGFTEDGKWRIFSLRDDFVPAVKLQQEDDITASIVVPAGLLKHGNPRYGGQIAYKIISKENPEKRFFQRPDEAIHRGYDKTTEAHFGRNGNFFSNYAPMTAEDATSFLHAPIAFGEFTQPMQEIIQNAARNGRGYFVSSANPRLVDGKPSKNPRYLQLRPDMVDRKSFHLAEMGMRLHRHVPAGEPFHTPVNAVLPGRRLNPPEPAAGIRSLAVYNPVHYQETPELFMEFISSLTGKSPSTTGAGSEGALTKSPFNALRPIIDLNNALVSHILTGSECFVTAAGYVGPRFRVDHDISLLIPEVWARMDIAERDPRYLIENGYLEKVEDFDYKGTRVLASRLGYRITAHFVSTFFGAVFDNPNDIFPPEMLRPETQDMDSFVDGMDNIVGAQKQIAEHYFADGSIQLACPPLRALLYIMRDGQYENKDINHPEVRGLFTQGYLVTSGWYQQRLLTQQTLDIRLWNRHIHYLESFIESSPRLSSDQCEDCHGRLQRARERLEEARSLGYVEDLRGFIGADPSVIKEVRV